MTCACGCGQAPLTHGAKYVLGHNARISHGQHPFEKKERNEEMVRMAREIGNYQTAKVFGVDQKIVWRKVKRADALDAKRAA